MKKTIVRIVAIGLLAVMLLSALPALAAPPSSGVISNTKLYPGANNVAPNLNSESGVMMINGQAQVQIDAVTSDNMYYHVVFNANGTQYSGWVAASSLNNGSGTTTGTTSGSTSSGTTGNSYTATLANGAQMTDANGKVTHNISTGGKVTVHNRDAAGQRIYITVNGTTSGWVNAGYLSNIRDNSGQITVDKLPANSALASASAGYTTYPTPKTMASRDKTIYMRKTASKSTSSSNVAYKAKDVKGDSFSILGVDPTGQWLFASYGGHQGFVRAQDFTEASAPSAPTAPSTPTAPTTSVSGKVGTSTTSSIELMSGAGSGDVIVKITDTKGVQFDIVGESGNYWMVKKVLGGKTYQGYAPKSGFTVSSGSAAATNPAGASGSGSNNYAPTPSSSSKASNDEIWGYITIPGAKQYPVYGNYTAVKSGKTYYKYDYNNIKSYNYVHTMTGKGSQIAVMMLHNMRTSRTYGHNLHHIQNAILGKSTCEKCKKSTSGFGSPGVGTNLSINWEGQNTWQVVAFYEIPKNGSSSILQTNCFPNDTASYLAFQKQYANSSYKGWCNSGALTANGKYIMLITCGDETDSKNVAKLYMLVKAVG